MDGQDHSDLEGSLHDFRKEIDACIKRAAEIKQTQTGSPIGREISLVYTKLQEAKMWAGKCLEAVGAPFPAELRDEAP